MSKRLGSPYRSGRSRHWVKNKNPKQPAVKREAEARLRRDTRGRDDGIRKKLAAGVSQAIFASSRVKHRTDDGSRKAQAWIAREGQCAPASARTTFQAARGIGSRARTRMRQR